MRLIDAYALEDEFGVSDADLIAKEVIRAAPTIDAVEVVRCRCCAVPHNKYTGCPKLNGLVTPPDFYCPFGERKEGE